MALLKISSLLLLLGFCTFSNAAVDQTLILNLHNKLRAGVGASNMLAMVSYNSVDLHSESAFVLTMEWENG
jgi:hypothetical protein